MFEGDNVNESLILGGGPWALSSADTEYGQVMSSITIPSNTENDFRQVVPTAGTLKNLYVKLSADPGVNGVDAYRFTVRLNGASPGGGLVVTITADDVTGSDLANDIDVVAGDVVTMMIEPLNGPAVAPFAVWGMTFVADIDGESIILGGSNDALHDTDTEYNIITESETSTWGVENSKYKLGQVCTLKKFYVLLSACPGAGNDYDFSIRIAGTNVVTLQISDAETTGDSGGLSDDVALDEFVNLMCAPTDTPDAADAYWGFVCYTGLPPSPFPVVGSIVEAMTEIVYGDDD